MDYRNRPLAGDDASAASGDRLYLILSRIIYFIETVKCLPMCSNIIYKYFYGHIWLFKYYLKKKIRGFIYNILFISEISVITLNTTYF